VKNEKVLKIKLYVAAFLAGARFANRMGDPGAANYYISQADVIYKAITKDHWSPDSFPDMILATVNYESGPPVRKASNLDASVVLAALEARETLSNPDDFLQPNSGPVLLTALTLSSRMKGIHVVNSQDRSSDGKLLAPGIGRYPEDVYDG
jgi:glucoamylase